MARLQVTLDPPELVEGGLRLGSFGLTGKQYKDFCAANRDLRIERLATGEVIIMPPAHSRTSAQNAELIFQLKAWAKHDETGIAFDSSAGFDLPNGANRGPDASWVLKSRIEALAPEERDDFYPLSPDFVIELRSKSDRLSELQDKMQEYLDNGTRLGWLIDPFERKVHRYRSGAQVEILIDPSSISGDPELPGFQLDLRPVWDPGI